VNLNCHCDASHAIKSNLWSSNGIACWHFLPCSHVCIRVSFARTTRRVHLMLHDATYIGQFYDTLMSRQRSFTIVEMRRFFARSWNSVVTARMYTRPVEHCVWFGECVRRACIISMVTRHNGKQNKVRAAASLLQQPPDTHKYTSALNRTRAALNNS
jgi:hypothetical protein